MNYLVVGLNHKTAPLELREKFAFSFDRLGDSLIALKERGSVDEGLILSTCNRVEIYAAAAERDKGTLSIKDFLLKHGRISEDHDDRHFYHYSDLDAVRHVFRVASSLDSMVVGETQITGQVKKAYGEALASKTSGYYLNRCLNRALYVAKRVRSETDIGSGTVSVGSAAVDLARRIFGDMNHRVAALIGAGKIGELVVRCLKGAGVGTVHIINRSMDRARAVAEVHRGMAYGLEDLHRVLLDVDVVITSMDTDRSVLTKGEMRHLMDGRKNRPLFLIDLGVPRNLEPSVNSVQNVFLYNIDDLKEVVDSGRGHRVIESVKAEEIVNTEARLFYHTVTRSANRSAPHWFNKVFRLEED